MAAQRPIPKKLPHADDPAGATNSAAQLARLEGVEGISLQQRRYLAARLFTETDAAACQGICAVEQPSNWKARNAVFDREYERVINASTDDLFARFREELARGAQAASLTARDLLSAEDPIHDKAGRVVGAKPAWNARAKGVESYQRAAGLWNPQQAQPTDTILAVALSQIASLQQEALDRRQRSGEGEAEPSPVRGNAKHARILEGKARAVEAQPTEGEAQP